MEVEIADFGVRTGIFAIMNTAWGWPTAESLHFIGLSLLVGSVGLFDLRMLGMAKSIPLSALHKLVPWGVFGYAINVTTGVMFFVSDPTQYLYNPAFQSKVLCMLIAGVNMIVFYTTMSRRVKALPDAADAPWPVKVVAFVSLACWTGVITGGRLITFYRPPEHWCFWCS